jgi:hypothetical protein
VDDSHLILVELGKRRFYRAGGPSAAAPISKPDRHRRIHHRASRWSVAHPLAGLRGSD